MLDKIKINAHHYHLSDNTKAFIQEKLSKIDTLGHYIVDGEFLVNHETHHFKVEITLHFPRRHFIHLHEKNQHLYPAIETLVSKLKPKIAEYKDKLKDHHGHPHHNEDSHTH